MTKTIRILTLLALMVIGAGQAWAKTEPDLGKIVYTQTVNDHGTLSFYADETCQTAISNPGNGLNSSGLTPVEDGSNVIGYKVYIKATPDLEYTLGAADEGGKVTFIKAEVTVETNVAGARTRGTAPTVGVGDFLDVTATTTTGVYCMTMPADKNLNLLVTATFVEKPMNTAAISYIDADGVTQTKDAGTVYILDGTETTLGRSGYDTANNNKPYETWYVCNTAVDTEHPYGLAYDHGLALYGNVHLILADGCKMTVTNSSGNAINSINEIAIHGQSTGNNAGSLIAEGSQYGIYTSSNIAISGGQVTAFGTNQSGINSQAGTAISINSCIINATGANYGIYASGNITISGGQVTASGTNQSGINSQAGTAISIINSIINATGAKYGIYGSCSEITISGGAVTATGTSDGGIYCGPGKISITDCNVTATGGSNGIRGGGDVTITRGKVEAVATGTNGNGIYTEAQKILITDCEVIVTGGSNGIKVGADVTINGGKVTATGTSGSGIESGDASNISITNCEVNAEGGSNGIKSGSYGVTINGGKVTATGTNGSGIESVGPSNISITNCEVNAEGGSNGIKGSNGVTISGGQVVANYTGSNGYGIYSGINGITLGWTNATDYICANSYATNYNGPVKTTDGQRFVAYNMANESDISATAIVSGSSTDATPTFTLDAIARKTLKPLVGNIVSTTSDISLTDGTTAKTPDFTIGETSYYKYSENASVTLTATDSENRMLSSVTLSDGTISVANNGDNKFTFTMGTSDVTVTAATFLEKVSYIDPTATGDDKTKTVFATPLTGNETVLGTDDDTPTWYVVNGDVNFDHALEINKDVCIILTNEKTMNVGSESSPLENYGIAIRSGSQLTIYGQGGATEGSLNIYSNESSASFQSTYVGNTITICGGHVVTSNTINFANGTVQILGGTFTDKAAFSESAIPYSIQASKITIDGGAVSANGLLFAETDGITVNGGSIDVYQLEAEEGNITLGWTNAETDFIATTNGYKCNDNDGNLTFATGKRFYAYDGENVAAVYDAQTVPTKDDNKTYPDLAGKTLKPCTDLFVTITKDANGYSVNLAESGEGTNPLPIDGTVTDLDYSRTLTAPTSGTYDYMIDGTTPANLFTVCLPFAPTTGTGVKYYTLNSVSGTTVNFKEVKTTPAAFTPYLVAVTGNSTVTESCTNESFSTAATINSTTKDGFTFTGTLTGLSNADALSAAGSDYIYILQHNAQWCKVKSGNNNVKIPPFRAYITGPDVTTTSGARELNSSFDGEAAGIDTLRLTDSDGTEHWYDLNGRRIEKPTRKGVFIHGGRKEVIR